MEQKVRFKMHKVKKNWVTIGVTALSMVTVVGGTCLLYTSIQISRGVWYYFNASGQAVTGEQVINGQHLYFDASGRQVKGRYVWVKGQRRYYDANIGAWVRKR